MLRYSPALAALLALPNAAVAQDAFLLDEIVISAAVTPSAAASTGTTVSVVTGEELRETGEIRLIDALDRLPGVGILSRGPIGTLSSLTIRGASRNYVQVLVDGIDVTDPSGPQVSYDFGHLTTADISRIEVLRGAQSALYGSQAIGGVISITTLRADGDGTTVSVAGEVGSFGTVRGSTGFTTREGGSAVAATISHVTTDGFSAADEDDGNSEADGYTATRLSISGETVVGDGIVLGASAFYEDGAGSYDEQFPLADGSPDEETAFTSYGLRASATFFTGSVENEVAVSTFGIDRKDSGSTGFGASEFNYEGRRHSASYRGTVPVGEGNLSFGGSYTEESYAQDSTFGSNGGDNSVVAAFAEFAGPVTEALDVTATLRFDEHSQFGSFVTGRLAGAYRLAPDLILRGSLANGFRAPSNYELFGPFGDPTLQPEESVSIDLGIEKRYGDMAFVRATLFHNETTDLIDFNASFVYDQIPGTVTRTGLELEGGITLANGIGLTGNYTYTDADNPALSAGNTWNSDFGTHDVSLGISAPVTDRITVAGTLQYVADREMLPDYGVAHATVTYAISEQAEAYLRVENLTDEAYQLQQGYGTSDRAFYAGFRARF